MFLKKVKLRGRVENWRSGNAGYSGDTILNS